MIPNSRLLMRMDFDSIFPTVADFWGRFPWGWPQRRQLEATSRLSAEFALRPKLPERNDALNTS
ncbi:MAG: hypothetical protein JWM11_1391 [Planctomycetaceae bacterium]|nr:hypothetical protein [Planctomycetaceae bacterium]